MGINCNLYTLAAKEYKKYYPKLIQKYFHFIEKNTSKIIINNNIGIAIEGTRKKNPFIRSGYKYLALNNNCDIIYVIINYSKFKVEISEPIYNKQIKEMSDTELFAPLKKLLVYNHAIYPKECSDIKFRTN